ncbi:Protein SIP5 [Candida viswanathii]|uniref:Protein SIP5 n=1 Tax=Candida viswanathii TaxID=5486 RepID=A0A367XSK7_9ASCO|nr:Protein SIP5 [Candida viswanathii]
MGNVPAKESRSRSSSSVSDYPNSSSNTPTTSSSTASKRRNTTSALYGVVSSHHRSGSDNLRKLKKQEEKDRAQQLHYMQLIVRFDENVDGGYLAPYGTYKSNLDYDCDIVRNLIVNRQLSPFFTPLQDFDDSWTDDELCILLNQSPLHALEPGFEDEDEPDDIDNHKIHKSSNYYKRQEEKVKLKSLIAKVKELQKDEEQRFLEEKQAHTNKNCPSRDLLLRLYRNASECPICFLYYPKHLNVSRCCLQPICSECFVQIKRLDPHPPHDDNSNQHANELPHTLISEPANCPYCASPDFGVTYEPPRDIHTGINGVRPADYKTSAPIFEGGSDDEDSGEVAVGTPNQQVIGSPTPPPVISSPQKKTMKRRGSLAANAPGVISIDMIRPDWETKLNSARSKLARKAATASAIHASNLLLDENGGGGSSSRTASGSGGRRRNDSSSSRARSSTVGSNNGYAAVEQRMIEEAMRLSLIDEEQRKKKAAKESKK